MFINKLLLALTNQKLLIWPLVKVMQYAMTNITRATESKRVNKIRNNGYSNASIRNTVNSFNLWDDQTLILCLGYKEGHLKQYRKILIFLVPITIQITN